MIRAKTLNKVLVEPIALPKKNRPALGCELFPLESANIFLVAPKNSGKTTVIKKILDECADEDTHVIIFCGTVHNDPSWKVIREDLQKRGIKYSAFISIFKDKINLIDVLIETLQGTEEEHFNGEDDMKLKKDNVVDFGAPLEEQELPNDPKKKKKKYDAPDYIIIMDDLSTELKNVAIPKLMKIHRHFSSKIIISSQSWNDTDARIRKGNLDYVLLFKNIPEEVLKQIHEELAIPLPFKLFEEMYMHATAEKYHFLYIDRSGVYRKDFNKEYQIMEL